MRNKSFLFILIAIFFSLTAKGQYHTPVETGLTGTNLLNALVADYKPLNILDYDDARDSLFASVLSKNDSLTCVYSGHTIYLNPNQDPTEAAYMNGTSNGINTEHTWPQGFGASQGNPKSNMYHLFPTRIEVNSARGNSPFAEITDSQTDQWYYLNQSQTSVPPSSTIDLFSERRGSQFEPREDHKGDVARAMFYFYTMYKAQADAVDPNFFEIQKTTLCNWHFLDPVDEREWQRNLKIATYQEGKYNPFILDCTLPERCFCENVINETCTPTTLDANEPEKKPYSLAQNYPNPFSNETTISYNLDQSFQVRLAVYNVYGEQVKVLVDEEQGQGAHQTSFNTSTLPSLTSGVYTYTLELRDGDKIFFETRKFIVWK